MMLDFPRLSGSPAALSCHRLRSTTLRPAFSGDLPFSSFDKHLIAFSTEVNKNIVIPITDLIVYPS